MSEPRHVSQFDLVMGADILQGLRENCTVCNVVFETPGYFVHSKDKAFALFTECPAHRKGADMKPSESPDDRKFRVRRELEERWTKMCPKIFRDIDPATLPAKLAAVIKEYSPKDGKGIFLLGETGTQKSRASHRLMQDLHMAGKSVRMFHAGEFYVQCIASYRNEGYDAWIHQILQADHVLFDDLGQEKFVDRDGRALQTSLALYHVVDSRLSAGRPTHFNSNFFSEVLVESIFAIENGAQLLRRMQDGMYTGAAIDTGKTDKLSNLKF